MCLAKFVLLYVYRDFRRLRAANYSRWSDAAQIKFNQYSMHVFVTFKFCCCSLLLVFGVRVSVTFHLMCVHMIFISVSVAEWPPFGK